MIIPATQFYVFIVNDDVNLCQTYEAALNKACEQAKATEFIDMTPDDVLEVVLFFPKTARKITIKRKLFTYSLEQPLATPNYNYTKNTYDYKNIGF